MKTDNARLRKIKKQIGEWNMDTVIEKDGVKAIKRRKRLQSGLKIVAVVGIGAGLYGFKLGRQSGIREGLTRGYVVAGNEMIEAWREHTAEMRLSRGE